MANLLEYMSCWLGHSPRGILVHSMCVRNGRRSFSKHLRAGVAHNYTFSFPIFDAVTVAVK